MAGSFWTKNKEIPIPEANPQAGLRRREGWIGLLFLSPWLVGFALLKLLPILAALGFSFTDFHMLRPEQTRFIGLANYLRALTDIGVGGSLMGSLGYFLLTVPLQVVAALGLAAIFSSERLIGKSLMRPLFFMPSIIPAGAILFIWIGFVDARTGWLNRLIMEPLGMPPIPISFASAIILFALWSIGPGFLIMYGAMQAIPKEIIEAARVDGAGPLLRFVSIVIPMISPAIFFTLVINLTSAFGGTVLLDRGYLFSRSLSPMEGYINYMIFNQFELGYAATLAWVMFAVTMSITIALFRSANRWVYFPEEHDDEEI
jgi:ABC-type sugar transport system permease subunit